MYNRHRYYDPSSGRFVSEDPIGLAGGINVHQYGPDPVQWVDPLGLARSGQWGIRTNKFMLTANASPESRRLS
nr:RHS repeat-associated core domain-containing protein [Burkholderia sp. BCC1993]